MLIYINILLIFNIKVTLNNLSPVYQEEKCPICYNFIRRKSRPNCCYHYFCRDCINQWSKFKKTCPLCRKNYINIK